MSLEERPRTYNTLLKYHGQDKSYPFPYCQSEGYLPKLLEDLPELFCTNKQNYVEKEIDSSLKSIHKEEIMVDTDEADVIPESVQMRKFMVSYKEQNKYLQDLNENLMLANKRL